MTTEERADVLVVDDDPEINALVGTYAEIAGFSYRSALDGAEGLRKALECKPALVVLDVMLPDTDGFSVCSELKKQAVTAAVPVLMLTAMDRDDSRERGHECGVSVYMTKPFDPDALIAAIRDHALATCDAVAH